MPNVLAKLGAEVLVVNPYASTAAVVASDRAAAAEHVADLVRASGAHLGAVIDPGGEHIILVDDDGPGAHRRRGAPAPARRSSSRPPRAPRWRCPVAVPTAAERDLRRRPEPRSCGPSCRPPHLMELSRGGGRRLRRQPEGGFIFPSFLPAFDAVATLVHLLAMLAIDGRVAVEADAEAPRPSTSPTKRSSRRGSRRARSCASSWSGPQGATVVLVDGVKIPEADGMGARGARPRGAAHPRLGRGPTDAGAAARASEHAVRHPPDDALSRSPAQVVSSWAVTASVSGRVPAMQVPDDVALHAPTTSGSAQDDGTVRIGITDYAQDALGDVVFVQLPAVGAQCRRGGHPRRGRVDEVGLGDLRAGGR